MRETGKVINRSSDGTVDIETTKNASCAKCGICIFQPDGKHVIHAADPLGAAIGDHVEFCVSGKSVITASVLIFIMPLIVFYTAFFIQGVLSAIFALSIYLIILYFIDRKRTELPTVTKVLYNSSVCQRSSVGRAADS